MIEPKLSHVKGGAILTVELINSIIKRVEYIAEFLYQSKPVAGNDVYVEPHFDGTRISFLRAVGGGSQPSFRGGNVPFPNVFWPKSGQTYNSFVSEWTTTYGLDYRPIPSSSLAKIIRNGQERYEYIIDFSGAEIDEDGYVKDLIIHSPTPFTIYYEDGTFEEAIEGGGYYPYPYFFPEWYIKSKAKPASISFSTETPSMRASPN